MALAMRSSVSAKSAKVAPASRRTAVVVRADGGFIGSSTNLIMMASTGACLAASRFGLAPSSKRNTTAGLKLVDAKSSAGVVSGDPAGFSVVDVMAMGAAGHGIGIGIVLGLKGIGAL